jgi:hypothetical protein
MISPKEKALELVEGMYSETQEEGIHGDWYIAKKCALIAVDEILKAIPNEYLETYKGESNFIIKYWQEVKNEINKL